MHTLRWVDGAPRWGICDGNIFANQALDATQQIAFFVVTKRKRDAFAPSARGAANPMHIRFWDFWQIEVHDVGDVVDINTAGRDVGCD